MAATSQPSGLTDTDILIDSARGVPEAIQFIAACQAGGNLSISIVSAMELVCGARDKLELQSIQQFTAALQVLPITESVSRNALQLIETFHPSHGLLLPDALIAATALDRGLKLYTKNARHFQMLPGLVVERPY
jgi:predicted nucleic acid-binding protein